jgi:glycosyltransferase involved in cell wall biosynthesis
MRTIRVAHLTSVHSRSDVRIFEKEATSLARAGYETYLVVGDGRGDEVRDGVRVVDVGAAPAGRLCRMLLQPWRVLRRARSLGADIYHFHDPELLPVGLALRVRGAQVIYDSHEDLPRAVLSKHWIPLRLRRAIAVVVEWIEDFAARRLSAVVTATPHIERRFVVVNPVCVAINNYPQRVELALEAQGTKLARTVCYVGGIGRIRGAIEMVRALEGIDARLVLAGPFESEDTEAELRALPGWNKVDYRGVVTRQQVHAILAQAQAGLLFFHPEPNHVDAQPNKMFEYMSAGLPVLASDFSLWRELLVESGAGLCANPFDPRAIAGVIERLLDDPQAAAEMGRRGRDLVLQRYHWEFEERKLEELYRSLPV